MRGIAARGSAGAPLLHAEQSALDLPSGAQPAPGAGAALNHVTEHGVAELRLEPGALGGHDAARVGNGHQILDAGRKEGESAGVFFSIDKFFQFRRAADAADEMNALA